LYQSLKMIKTRTPHVTGSGRVSGWYTLSVETPRVLPR
jgi:hypothetical protein